MSTTTTLLLLAIFPVFALLAAGLLTKWLGWMESSYAEGLNRYVYYLAFPTLLFIVIARSPRAEILNMDFLGAWTVALLVGYSLAGAISLLWRGGGFAPMAVRSFNSSCGNTSMVGIPLCIAAFGKEAALFPVMATIVNAVVGVSMTVLFIETSRQAAVSRAHLVGRIAWSLAKNPLMLSFILGFACAAGYGAPPPALNSLCDMLGGSAIPCSLVATGLFFAGHLRRIAYVEASVFTFFKLIVQPLIGWAVARYLFGIDGQLLAIIVILSAMPLASTCFVIAQRFDVLAEETSSMMIISTVASLATLSVLLAWFVA
jgi:malonate transporter and related proteins